MRTFIISDIHGNNDLFRRALKEIRLKKIDKLILLGDLIDRGPDSKGVLDTIILLLKSGFTIDCLMGNHERMFLDAKLNTNNLNQWLINGGDKTLFSFLTNSINKISQEYFNLLGTFKNFVQTEDFIFVHAALNMKIEYPFTDVKTILWEREPMKFLDEQWLGCRRLVHGHTPQTQSEIINSIENNERIICIDNGIYLNKLEYGSLCILELGNLNLTFFT